METTPPTDEQQLLIDLRAGNTDILVSHTLPPVGSPTTGGTSAAADELTSDFDFFRLFLAREGNINPSPRDLYLTVSRQSVIRMLDYAISNGCLVFQNCFGFDKPINQGGHLEFIQKGNFWQERPGITDDDIPASIFKRINPNSQKEFLELYRNFEIDSATNLPVHLPVGVGDQYLSNFRAYYPGRTRRIDPFVRGYLLPLRCLLNVFNDPNSPFSTATELTFRWGLTSLSVAGLGNFTLVIGLGDVSTGPVIVFRLGGIGVNTGSNPPPVPVPCPPNGGC